MHVDEFVTSGEPVWISIPLSPSSVVCVIDSSFNPPNRAHLALARLCREAFADCYLLFMLGTGNADKTAAPVKDLQDRANMIQLLIQSEFPNDIKAGWSLTTKSRFADKAATIHSYYQSSMKLVFALGFDTLVRLGDQKYYSIPVSEVLSQFFNADNEILVLTRNEDSTSGTPNIGSVDEQCRTIRNSSTWGPFEHKITLCLSKEDTDGVSSSAARESQTNLIKQTTPTVAKYALDHKLYKSMFSS